MTVSQEAIHRGNAADSLVQSRTSYNGGKNYDNARVARLAGYLFPDIAVDYRNNSSPYLDVYKMTPEAAGRRFAQTVDASDAPFVRRLRNPDGEYVQNNDGSISTHRLSWADIDRGPVVYPEVQRDDRGVLVDYGRAPYSPYAALYEAFRKKYRDTYWYYYTLIDN